MAQKFFFPVIWVPNKEELPLGYSERFIKINLPDFCSKCTGKVTVKFSGSLNEHGSVNCCDCLDSYDLLWENRILDKKQSNDCCGGYCNKCNTFNEYQNGPYICYSCNSK